MLNPRATRADRDALRERLGLNQTPVMQFVTFVGNAARGEFGISYRNQQAVGTLIAERFPATFELVMVATLAALLAGLPLGVYAAINRSSPIARALHHFRHALRNCLMPVVTIVGMMVGDLIAFALVTETVF